MKYVAMVYYPESTINAMTEQEWHDLNQECIGCVERLGSIEIRPVRELPPKD